MTKIAVFGDSFVSKITYENNQGETWPRILRASSLSTVSDIVQYASGGAVSGREFAYAIDGQTLPTPGLLTQVESFEMDQSAQSSIGAQDLITIHVGTNDICSWLFTPYKRENGTVTVDASDQTKIDRASSNLDDVEFAKVLMSGYTAGNIVMAYNRLIQHAPTMVIGPIDVGQSVLALGFDQEKQRAASAASMRLASELQRRIPVKDYVSVVDLPLTLVDEIHPDYRWQRSVAGLAVTNRSVV